MSSTGFQPEGIDGRKLTQEECDELHFLYNAPTPPKINGRPLAFTAYEYRPYPAAMYGVWTDESKRRAILDVARTYSLNLKEPLQREEAESRIPPYDSRVVGNDRERQAWLDKGWTDNPDDVAKAHDNYIANVIAVAAAERAYTDRRMSEKAKEEFRAADRANGEDHLLDLPAPPVSKIRKKPGPKPKKQEPTPSAA